MLRRVQIPTVLEVYWTSGTGQNAGLGIAIAILSRLQVYISVQIMPRIAHAGSCSWKKQIYV